MSFGLKICGKIDLMGPTKWQLLILQLVVYAEIWLLLGICLGLSTGLYRPVDRPPHAEVRLARSKTVFILLMELSALLVRFARTTPFRRKADAVLVYGHIGAVLRYIRLS